MNQSHRGMFEITTELLHTALGLPDSTIISFVRFEVRKLNKIEIFIYDSELLKECPEGVACPIVEPIIDDNCKVVRYV